MINFQSFMFTLIETTSVMFLWDTFIMSHRDLKRYFAIVISTSIIVTLSNLLSANFTIFINYSYLMAIMMALYKKKMDEILIEFGIVSVVIMIIQIIIMTIIGILKVSIHVKFIGLITNIILLIASIIINRCLLSGTICNNYRSYIRKSYVLLINTVFYVLITKFIWESNNKFFTKNMIYFTIISFVFIFLNIIFLINNIKYQEQKKVIQTYDKYSLILSNLIEDIKRRQHDFNNHLNTIYGIIQTSNEKEIKNILKAYIKSVNNSVESNNSIIQVRNPIIAAIIYNKICEEKYKHIIFQYEIDNTIDLPLKQYELSEVLNNLLNNAFEASEKAESSYRNVQLKIYEENKNSIIEVNNTVVPSKIRKIDRFFVRGFSTKSEKGHGYGLYNLQKIVESNNGEIQLSLEEDSIKFKILF